MTINAQYKPIKYIANGVSTSFTINWKFFNEELSVIDETGAEYNSSLYSILNSNTSSGGSIIFKEPPAIGKSITISRKVPLKQDVTFIEGENFPAEDYEYSLDRIYMVLQEYGLTLDKAITLPDGYDSVEEFVSGIVHIQGDGTFNGYTTYKRGDICQMWGVGGCESITYLRIGDDISGAIANPYENPVGWIVIGLSGATNSDVESLRNSITALDEKIGDIDNVLDVINGEVV